MRDNYGREINYARISITDLCNLRCLYCMPKNGIQKKSHEEILRLEEIVTVAKALVDLGIDKIRLTGGEPLIRKGFLFIAREIGKLEGLKDFAITTNGVLLPQYAVELKEAGINRVNISLDTLNNNKFKEITVNGNVKDVIDGIQAAEENSLKIKINVVLIKGFNTDEISEFVEMTKDKNIDVRFIELMAIGETSGWSLDRYVDCNEVLKRAPELRMAEGEDKSSPAVYYKLPGGKGRVGLIRPISGKFCAMCNRIRITADGKIKSCLHSDTEIDIKDKIQNYEMLKQGIIDAINQKPYEHELDKGKHIIKRDMSRIGG